MNTKQIRFVAKTTKRKSRTRKRRLEAFEAGAQITQSHMAERLRKQGLWDPYAAVGSSLTVYKKGEEPK
jgi:hypothetical protein